MLTVEKIKKIVTESFLKTLKKDAGITVFFGFDDYGIGVSFETGNVEFGEEEERYIFNVFAGCEYLNVNYVPGNHGLNDDVFQDLADVWNRYVDIKKILVERIQVNSSINEIEDILGEQITADLVENLEEHLENALYELNEDAFGKIMIEHMTPTEIGNICKLAF